MPVKHVVMFGFKPEVTDAELEAFRQGLLELPNITSNKILAFEIGQDLRLPSGLNHPAGPNRQLIWSVTLANVQDYQTYNESESHQAFLRTFGPLVAPGQRAAIQYNVDPV